MGYVPFSVLTLIPIESSNPILSPTPLHSTQGHKKTVCFKEEHEKISRDDLMSPGYISIDDLPGTMIASGVSPNDHNQLIRVYAGNFSQKLSGYRTLLANENDTVQHLTMNAIQKFRLTFDPFTMKARLTLENINTHHNLLLPDPSITTLGTVIELAKWLH